jgi:hypothetical protein
LVVAGLLPKLRAHACVSVLAAFDCVTLLFFIGALHDSKKSKQLIYSINELQRTARAVFIQP